VIPVLRRSFLRKLQLFRDWYNDRPHTTLACATPDEIYFARRPAWAPHALNRDQAGLAPLLALVHKPSSRANLALDST
jgi:hypothetical protein